MKGRMMRAVAILLMLLAVPLASCGEKEPGREAFERAMQAHRAENFTEARALFEQSCEEGGTSGCYNAALMSQRAEGGETDPGLAQRYFAKACEGGISNACESLALMLFAGEGIPKDRKEAMRWARIGADRGHTASQYRLGLFKRWEYTVSRDLATLAEAKDWIERAAAKGHVKAQESLPEISDALESAQKAPAVAKPADAADSRGNAPGNEKATQE